MFEISQRMSFHNFKSDIINKFDCFPLSSEDDKKKKL